ncbi:hypothetical protein Lmor_0517 [Legionella moravica]|uniref:Uncharacterized protein n=1 Tax=Legionella moravica TaxID=39962 RepID=A0A378K1I4_9GAMM|nr:hypothetical protein [Legionella moravica]KTD37654.1 hypothetical protein Lmor_0517 [Legionella moravica]STX61701.1 Uncharacterised protein [Legionella moravica]HEN5528819.1 hypothetical protein [Legionella pneumophila]
MSPKNSNTDKNEDPRKQAIESNPCGICRSAGIPNCKGHKGGAGGGETSDEESEELIDEHLSSPMTAFKPSVNFIKSEVWRQPDSWESVFEFKNPDALITIKLDFEQGILCLSSKERLPKDQQKAVDELFNAIKNEFNQFKKELANQGISVENMQLNHQGNNLTLNINKPKLFDAFIQRLMDKNLLIAQAPTLQNDKQEKFSATPEKSMNTTLDAKQDYNSTAPTPFDMTPKPKY